MGTGFFKKKKQAKMLQEQLRHNQTKMTQMEVTGIAGNGLVTLTLNGDNELKQLLIKPECVDPEDVEGLQDLIKAAHADALQKLKEQQSQNIPKMPPGMPGMPHFGF